MPPPYEKDEPEELGDGNMNVQGNAPIAGSHLTFCADQTCLFEEKEEKKLFLIRERASRVLNRLENPEYPLHVYAQLIESVRNEIISEWPSLFGAEICTFFVHFDLDCFFAAVEILEHPEYKYLPLAVGSKQMLATCNYNARKYGIHAGMPGYKALCLCPSLVIVKSNFERYSYYSKNVMNILRIFDEDIEIYGIDEACLLFDGEKLAVYTQRVDTELRKFTNLQLSAAELTQRGADITVTENVADHLHSLVFKIRTLVFLKTGLTVSAGISVCRGLSKLASKMNKPNGQMAILKEFDKHLLGLRVEEINGIGKQTKEFLEKTLNIVTIKDLRDKMLQCAIIFNRNMLCSLLRHSYGLASHDISTYHNIKRDRISHSISRTVSGINPRSIMDILWNFSGCLSEYLAVKNRHARLLTITIKFRTFDSVTKQKRWKKPFQDQSTIFDNALSILDSIFKRGERERWIFTEKIRLVGLAVSRFVDLGRIGRLKFERLEARKDEAPSSASQQAALRNGMIESVIPGYENKQKSLFYYFQKNRK